MPIQRRTPRPLLVTLTAGALLLGGASAAAAVPATAPAPSATTVALASSQAAPLLAAPRAATPATTPSPTTSPSTDQADDTSPGLPWPGIIVGGGLGLVAGIVLMVLGKRRENRG